jgi:hypothetical protein
MADSEKKDANMGSRKNVMVVGKRSVIKFAG